MAEEWSYPALRCVLEHLEANKRLHISGRSPILREVNKTIPLHLKKLYIDNCGFTLNNITRKYYCQQEDRHPDQFKGTVTPGQLQVGIRILNRRKSIYLEIHFENRKSGRKSSRRVAPDACTRESFLKKLAIHLLDFPEVFANQLICEMRGCPLIQLPDNFQLITRKINLMDNDFEDFLPILHPSCFPLIRVDMRMVHAESLQHPHLQFVTMNSFDADEPINFLNNSPCQRLEIFYRYNPMVHHDQVFMMVENWKNKSRGVGKSVVWRNTTWVRRMLVDINRQFGGEFKTLVRFRNVPYCLSIPIDATSELNIFGLPDDNNRMKLIIKEMKIGSSQPIVPFDPRYPPKSIFRHLFEKVTTRGSTWPEPSAWFILIISICLMIVFNYITELLKDDSLKI